MSNANKVVDTSFKGVERLIHQMAYKGFKRMEKARVMGADFDCVHSEMKLAYCKAARGFKPESGGQFTTYCVRVCWNEFNKYLERLLREQAAIGYISLEEIGQAASADSDDDVSDPLEFIMNQEVQESPEDRLEHLEILRRASACLSKESKEVLYYLVKPHAKMLKAYNAMVAMKPENPLNPRKADDISIAFIGEYLKIDKQVIKEIKKELGRVYGISQWNKGNGIPTYR